MIQQLLFEMRMLVTIPRNKKRIFTIVTPTTLIKLQLCGTLFSVSRLLALLRRKSGGLISIAVGPKCVLQRAVRMAAFLSLAACHSGNHSNKRDEMDKHERFVIPQSSHSKPPYNTNYEEVQIPRGPTEPSRRVSHNLNNG